MRSLKALAIAVSMATLISPAAAQQGQEIPYQKTVKLKVGQSAVVHGIRGACGSAPDKSDLKVPAAKTGKFSIGKTGWRNSKKCKGATPAVEVVFTATTPGKESVKVEGDKISITVTE